jgi:dTDP-4-dehydrorhamnose 3,5-epimerase
VKITPTDLPGVLLLQPEIFADARGDFFESFRADAAQAAGLPVFVQENQSRSGRGTLRGLHFQLDRPQGKLVRVVQGSIYDVAVDIREGSPTFGRWTAQVLSAENRLQLYIPPGFAHGFCALDEVADVQYKCTDYYSGGPDQRGVRWNDPALTIPWPRGDPQVNERDGSFALLNSGRSDLPRYQGAP